MLDLRAVTARRRMLFHMGWVEVAGVAPDRGTVALVETAPKVAVVVGVALAVRLLARERPETVDGAVQVLWL